MDDKRYPEEISLWCFATDTGDKLVCLPPFPCKKEAFERYRTEYPVLRDAVAGREALQGISVVTRALPFILCHNFARLTR
jgi:hypothetical protein